MGTNPMRFRVESNKAKSSFWYTLVAGNGNTTMTSKAKYSGEDAARRAARNQIESLQSSDLMLEFENADGELVQEVSPSVAAGSTESAGNGQKAAKKPVVLPTPSKAVFEANLNPNR